MISYIALASDLIKTLWRRRSRALMAIHPRYPALATLFQGSTFCPTIWLPSDGGKLHTLRRSTRLRFSHHKDGLVYSRYLTSECQDASYRQSDGKAENPKAPKSPQRWTLVVVKDPITLECTRKLYSGVLRHDIEALTT